MYDNYLENIKQNLILEPNQWYFKSDSNYRNILEHVIKSDGDKYLSEIINRFNKLYIEHKNLLIDLCNENDLYGTTIKTNFDNFTICSPSNLRYILHSFLILNYINDISLNNIDIIEIGGGYGGLCYYITKIAPIFNIEINSYTIFDLLEVSELQKKYLKVLNINNIDCYQLNNFKNLKTDSFLISNYAFSEISIDLQKEYTEKILNPYTKYGFLTWNWIDVYEFVKDKEIVKEIEFPLTCHNNYYVKFKPKNLYII